MTDVRERASRWFRFQYQARLRNAYYNRCWRCVWSPFHD